MSLTITHQNEIFNVEGKINSTTAKSFQTHMEFLFEVNKELVINIDNVDEIDSSGLGVLRGLYMYALNYNKDFYITGNGCKEIYHDFKYDEVA